MAPEKETPATSAAASNSSWVWECPYTGEEYEQDDRRLLGSGNPPASPNRPVGVGAGQPMAVKRKK